jgi:hypothetical protein
MLHPVLLDEAGVAQVGAAYSWSATSVDGSTSNVVSNCRDWTSSDPADRGGMLIANNTYLGDGFAVACDFPSMLLCLGDDSDAELPAPALTGRLAFVSSAFFDTGSGLAAADAICQREACAASLTGGIDCVSNPGSARVFKAYLHTSAQAAWERFDLGGPNWMRLDGITWLPDARSLAADAKDRITGMNVRADGGYTRDGLAWIGDPSGANCRDWSSRSAEDRAASTGIVIVDPRPLGGANSTDCSYASGRVLCLEQ